MIFSFWATFVVNCAITWLFVFTWDTGYLGLVFGMYIGYIWRTLVQIVSLYNHNLLKNVWTLTACNVLMDYEENVQMSRIGLQMVFQNMLNWWVFECIVILASWSTHGDPTCTAIAAIYTEILEFMVISQKLRNMYASFCYLKNLSKHECNFWSQESSKNIHWF